MKKFSFLVPVFLFTVFSVSAQTPALRLVNSVLEVLEHPVTSEYTSSRPNVYTNSDQSITLLTDGEVVKTMLVSRQFYSSYENETFAKQFIQQLQAAPDFRAVDLVPMFFVRDSYIYRANGVYIICYPPSMQMRNNTLYYPLQIFFTKDLSWYIQSLFNSR